MKRKMPYTDAERIASNLLVELRPYCQRIAAAGSLRRTNREIGDIELIAIPRFETDMFGAPSTVHALDAVDWERYGKPVKNGHKYKQIELHQGINLDLFIVTPPAQWGLIFLIRTGPAEYSHRLVTSRKLGGMLPSYLKVKGGAIWKNEDIINTPEERDVYELLGLEYVKPENRR